MALSEIIGRGKEKARLDKIMQSKQAEFLALYGHRRVGKTFLVRQYLLENIVFDISGSKEGSKERQISNFFDECLTRTKAQQDTRPPNSWHEAFNYLAKYLSGLPPAASKHVVFLDEMTYPALNNKYYPEEIDNEISMDKLFEP